MLRLCLFGALIAGVCVTTVAQTRGGIMGGFMGGYMDSAMDSLNNVTSMFSNIETAIEGVMNNS